MVVAYLRGLLPAHHKFGGRSAATENIILEALDASGVADLTEAHMNADLALVPALTQVGVKKVIERAGNRFNRASELRMFDIYKVSDQIAGKLKIENRQNDLSLFQIYQIAEKQGIFAAFDSHYTEEKAKPLL